MPKFLQELWSFINPPALIVSIRKTRASMETLAVLRNKISMNVQEIDTFIMRHGRKPTPETGDSIVMLMDLRDRLLGQLLQFQKLIDMQDQFLTTAEALHLSQQASELLNEPVDTGTIEAQMAKAFEELRSA